MRKRSSTLTSVAIAGVWAAAGTGPVVAAAAPATPICLKKLRRETLLRTPSSLLVPLGIVTSLDRVCLLLTSLIRVGSYLRSAVKIFLHRDIPNPQPPSPVSTAFPAQPHEIAAEWGRSRPLTSSRCRGY